MSQQQLTLVAQLVWKQLVKMSAFALHMTKHLTSSTKTKG